MFQRKVKPKDPIKDLPLREPGQSLSEEFDDIVALKFTAWAVCGVAFVLLALLEWYRWYFQVLYVPIWFSLFALIATPTCFYFSFRAFQQLQDVKLGLKGERATGQFLQSELIPLGYYVLHDICFDDFNVDHVAIGPGGVFSIETKTRRKPPKGESSITYNGETIRVNGNRPDRDPVVQARAGADSIKDILHKFAGMEAFVRPVVIFPGWFVELQRLFPRKSADGQRFRNPFF